MSMACSTHGDKRNASRVLVQNPEEKRQLGRSRGRWEDSIKMGIREIGGARI
jgi:hypothetical protein